MKRVIFLAAVICMSLLFGTSSHAATDKVQWSGTFSFPIKVTTTFVDQAGNRKFSTSTQRFTGTISLITDNDLVADADGCFIKFAGNDGRTICIQDEVSLTTSITKSKIDTLQLIGTGIFSGSQTGPVYMDTKGTLKKNSSGDMISISLNGKVAGGDGNELFNGNFKSTLTPIGNVLTVTTQLSGSQEVPPTGSAGSGTATFVINLGSGSISGNVTFSGLSSNAVAAHIHDGAVGVNGPIIIPLQGGAGGTSGVWTVPSGTIMTGAQLTALQAGQLYVNVHSSNFPGGEIRGQILP